jgi:hypothetical protein
MEWILIGLLAWWWCSRRQRADRAGAVQSRESSSHRTPIHFATPIAVVDDHGYWLADGRLVCAPFTQGVLDVDQVEEADPLSTDDLPPALVIDILEALEHAQGALEHPRSGQRGE